MSFVCLFLLIVRVKMAVFTEGQGEDKVNYQVILRRVPKIS